MWNQHRSLNQSIHQKKKILKSGVSMRKSVMMPMRCDNVCHGKLSWEWLNQNGQILEWKTLENIHGSYLLNGSTLIIACIRNCMPSKVWGEITYEFPNLNGAAVEIGEWISNFTLRFIMVVITYPYWMLIHVCKMCQVAGEYCDYDWQKSYYLMYKPFACESVIPL